jgi:hypothetical protein
MLRTICGSQLFQNSARARHSTSLRKGRREAPPSRVIWVALEIGLRSWLGGSISLLSAGIHWLPQMVLWVE